MEKLEETLETVMEPEEAQAAIEALKQSTSNANPLWVCQLFFWLIERATAAQAAVSNATKKQ